MRLVGHVSRQERAPWVKGPTGIAHEDTLEFCAVAHGREHLQLGGRTASVGRGEHVVIPPGREHASWTEAQRAELLLLHLRRDGLCQLGTELGARRPLWPTGAFRSSPRIRRAVRELGDELASSPGDRARPLILESLALQLSVTLLREHGLAGPARAVAVAATPRQRLSRVEEWMRAEPGEPHALEDLAAEAGMSPYHFVRSFRRLFGRPPRAHLLALRVERAEALMRTTDLTLTAIAFELGFASSSRLTEAFRKLRGTTPSHWRRARSGSRSAIRV